MPRTYGAKTLKPHINAAKQSTSEDCTTPNPDIRDAGELVGMGAIKMLADDIQYHLDSINAKYSTPQRAFAGLCSLRRILSLPSSGEFCRQFRAYNGLQLVFEWWAGHAERRDIQEELVWLFCQVGGKQVRRVDFFVDIGWIFATAHRLFDKKLSVDLLMDCDVFNGQVTHEKAALFLVGKACLCNDKSNSDRLKSLVENIVPQIIAASVKNNTNDEIWALLDVAVSMGVNCVRDKTVSLLSIPLSPCQLKCLVSVTGSENGWQYASNHILGYLIEELVRGHHDDEWVVCALSVLINCVDRCENTIIIDNNFAAIQSICKKYRTQEHVSPYSYLLLAFCLYSRPGFGLNAEELQGIKDAIHTFTATIYDVHSANTIKGLAHWLQENGWLDGLPKVELAS